MVKKLQKVNASKKNTAPLTGSVKDSAQQIWQAGLGAFNRAQVEGAKAFEALVKEGMGLQRKTQSAAEGKISEASSKISHLATNISSKASGHWDKLESIFEDRVAKALNKLGAPSAQDFNTLLARVDELNKSVQKLSVKSAPKKTPVKAAPKAATKTAPKKTVKTATKPAIKRAATRKTAAIATAQTPTS